MRSLYLSLMVVVLVWGLASQAGAAQFRLTNGDVFEGEGASFDDDGIVIRLDIGGFSKRIGWGLLTQESLKELAKNPQANKFVDAFIEVPPETQEIARKKREIPPLKEVPRLERPEKVGLIALFGTPAGWALLGLFYLANLYAAYEIAVFRQRPVAVVCGVSAVLPVLGPILFLSLPSTEAVEFDDPEAAAAAAAEALVSNPLAGGKKTTGPAVGGSGLSVAKAAAKTEVSSLEGSVFKRGDTTFNRRFFETKFSNFFPMIPPEAVKDLVLVFRAAKNEYVAKRISRISSNDLHLQLLRGTSEVSVSFTDISEVLVRRKDAKG